MIKKIKGGRKKMVECHCVKCGYDWESSKENPKSCPRCKRYDWRQVEAIIQQNK